MLLKNMYSAFLVGLALATAIPHDGDMGVDADMDMDMDADMGMDMMPTAHSGGDTSTSVISGAVAAMEVESPIPHENRHAHAKPILETKLTQRERAYWESYNTTTYFTIDCPLKGFFWYHVITIGGRFLFLYPIALMLNSAKSRWYLPVLTLYNGALISSLVCLRIFVSHAPNLYPNAAYGKMSYILFFATILQYCFAILYCASNWAYGDWTREGSSRLHQPFIPLQDMDVDENGENSENGKNGKSGRVSSSPSPSTLIDPEAGGSNELGNGITRAQSPQTYKDSLDLETGPVDEYEDNQFASNSHSLLNNQTKRTRFSRDALLDKVFQHPAVKNLAEKIGPSVSLVFTCMNIPMFLYLFAYVSTGAVTGSLLAQGNHVFNILAHVIKGGVFFAIGVFSLARYCGCCKEFGLAWNKMFVLKSQVNTNSIWYRWVPHGMITMEGYESFLIFFYGITNIFLEHLAAETSVWTAKDLQHVSIAFVYIGSGLCGLITEYMLSEWRLNQMLHNTKINPMVIHAGSPGYSPNPFPVFTIFWTGILMSQHEQSSETSTQIHMQWGYMLSYGSFFRLATFILLMLLPNKDLNPARPFTELVTSFCLICGGFVFMQSNDQTVQALEYRGLTSMFTLNVNVGIVALLMAWEMTLLTWKSRLQDSKQI